MACEVPLHKLLDFLEGSLDQGDMESLAAHVDGCDRCSEILLARTLPGLTLVHNSPPTSGSLLPLGREALAALEGHRKRPPADLAHVFPPYSDDGPLGPLEKYHNIDEVRGEIPIGQIDKYIVFQEIGQGSFGYVYKAIATDLRRLVALKVLKPSVARTGGASARFLREAEQAALIEDRHVVVVHEVLPPSDEFPWPAFVMQFVKGGSLHQHLERSGSKFEQRRAAEYARQTADGLTRAHARGLIHRDIKPQNLLLDETSDVVKIADFGVVRVLEEIPRTAGGSIHGTPAYMSPEQQDRANELGPESDVYNLGATLYELVTGAPPFGGPRRPDECVDAPRQQNPGLSRDLEAVILKCLDRNPKNRYTAAALEQELGRFLSYEPVKARNHTRWELLALWRRRSPSAFFLSATLAIVLPAATTISIVMAVLASRSATQARQDAQRFEEIAKLLQEDSHAMSSTGVFGVMTGQRDAAKTFFQTAVSVRERLVQLAPGVPEYRHDLALARMHMGNWNLTGGRYQMAVDAYLQCRPDLQDLAESHPDNPRYRFQFANVLDNHGMALLELQRPKEAEAAHRLALDNRFELVKQLGNTDEKSQSSLASTLNHLGNATKNQGKSDKAADFYEKSARILEGLAERSPTILSHQQEVAYCYINIGTLFLDIGDLPMAADFLAKAIVHQRHLYESRERLPDYGAELGAGLVSLGDLERRRKNHEQALKWYDQAEPPLKWAIDRVPENPVVRRYLPEAIAGRAICLIALGREQEAFQALDGVDELAREPSDPAEARIKIAAAMSLASGSPNVDPTRRDRWASRAVQLLREAVDRGYSKLPGQATELDREEFNTVRGRTDFRALSRDWSIRR